MITKMLISVENLAARLVKNAQFLLSKNNDKSIINIVINRFKPILEKIDVVDKSAPAFGFGTSKRPGSQKHRILLCPGPGTYNLSPLVGLTSTAKSIGIKW
jgi:hypothetical protein